MPSACPTLLVLALLAPRGCAPAWAGPPYSGALPAGSALVECEDLPRSSWHRHSDPEAGGGAKALANRADWVAEGEVELPEQSYAVWARSGDDGNYPDCYHYSLTIDGRTRRMAVTEPLGRVWVWERWGEVGGGRHTIRLDNAHAFAAKADCILFTPDMTYRPSGRPLVQVEATLPTPFPRGGGQVELRFTAQEPMGQQRLHYALREGMKVIWRPRAPVTLPPNHGRPGEVLSVSLPIGPLRFVPGGTYKLIAELSDCEYEGRQEGDYQVADVTLAPWEPVTPCVARVESLRGTPTLVIDGRPLFGFAFLGVGTGLYHEFAATGGHLYSMGASIGNGQPESFSATEADGPYRAVLEQDPQALVLPRIDLTAPDWWLEANPDERVVFDDGSLGPQSMASEKWLTDIGRQLERYVRHTRSSPYADRVIGYHLVSGVSAEWQAWGMWSERRGDFSRPMQEAFRSWLTSEYKTVPALRAAWGDPQVSFESARVPPREAREATGPALLSPQRSQAVIDFYRFYPSVTVRAIERFCRIVKQASDGEALAGAFYGYGPQYGPIAVESQHLGLGELLRCPDLDFLAGPAMYSDRQPGGTTNFMSLTDSIQQHGKLWFDEADIRTHLQDNEVGRCADLRETLGVLKREYAAVRSHGAGMWWFDMTSGWFSDPHIHDLFRTMREEGQEALDREDTPPLAPEIGVFYDEASALRQRQTAGGLYHTAITAQIAATRRIGAPCAYHLLSDLSSAPPYGLYLFLNAFDLTPAQRRTIEERLKRDGRLLVFVYAAGIGRVGDSGLVTEDAEAMRELTGMDIRELPGPGAIRAHLVDNEPLCANPVLIDSYGGRDGAYGPEGDVEPRFALPDRGLRVLARYPDGTAAAALKRENDFSVAYSATPGLPPGLLHNLAEEAGVHLYAEAGDALYAGRGVIGLHAADGGRKHIRLPAKHDVRRVLGHEGRWTAAQEIEFELGTHETAVFEVAGLDHDDR